MYHLMFSDVLSSSNVSTSDISVSNVSDVSSTCFNKA